MYTQREQPIDLRVKSGKQNESGKKGKGLLIATWTAQIVLACMFGFAGSLKLFSPISDLRVSMHWTIGLPGALIRFIGVSEIAGALGLILPTWLRIKPYLTTYAAIGLAVVMVLASLRHLSIGESATLPINASLFLLAAFVAWARLKKLASN